MKKFILLAIVFLAAGFLAWKLLSDKPAKTEGPKDQPLTIARNTSAFNESFNTLLGDYFAVRDALVDWDTLRADQAAHTLAAKADSLPVRLIKGDSTIVLTAKSLAVSLSGDAQGFMGETGIEARRHSFQMMTNDLYDLVRTINYDGGTIYHMQCPMAFSDSVAADWLSDKPAIVNPYLGNKHPVYKAKMLGCGNIVDSFAAKK